VSRKPTFNHPCPRCNKQFRNGIGSHVMKCPVTREELFWAKVARRGPDECWLWQAWTYFYGYGTFDWKGKKTGANRIAWELLRGPIPEGMEVCHACDVTACCNPNHLFLGTKSDNMRDMHSKGRHPNDRFKADDVRAIRAALANGVTQKDLAEKYKCNAALISMIKTGKNYAWVE
jgi:hypothetical protein